MVLRRVMIAGGRGGCGKSTVAAGLACALAQRGVRTAVLDFDLSERSLDMYLGCESRTVYDLSDLLSGERRPGGVAVEVPGVSGLFLIPGAYHLRRMPDAEETERLFSAIENDLKCETLIVDTSAASDPSVRLCCTLCEAAVLVAVPGALSVRSTASLADTLHEWGMDEIRMVVNRLSADLKKPTDLRRFIDGTGLRLLGAVPYSEALPAAQDSGAPACLAKGCEDVRQTFSNMAARLEGETCPLLSGTRLPRRKLLDI